MEIKYICIFSLFREEYANPSREGGDSNPTLNLSETRGGARRRWALRDGNRTDVTPGPAWSRYLNAVSGRFIADANRPTERPPLVRRSHARLRGGDLVNLYAV